MLRLQYLSTHRGRLLTRLRIWRITVQHVLALGGLGFAVAGGLILALADVWFSHAVLVYLDVVETNLLNAIEVLRHGGNQFETAGVSAKRDRSQDRARFLKFLGWA